MVNETLFHNESAVFRAVTGGAYNIPNSYGDIMAGTSFPKKGTIPIAVTSLGTITSGGKCVRGVGTQFTRLLIGSYLYDGNVLRQIDYIVSDTMLFLKQAFPTDISVGIALKFVERQYYKMIIATSTDSANPAILQEAPFRPNDKVFDGGAPYSYDATTGEISFQVSQ
ncbi:MAG TPA: hypothetical protein VL443_24415 [Cyclobacteriaceae bacterium]|jgi:hypothetical protein|nr:hypothetical protein [Cyclobacteriaceae bacterium]